MKIIDNTGGKIKLTVNEKEVIIDLSTDTRKLSEIQIGDTFKKNDVEYIVLEHTLYATTVVRKDFLKIMKFGKNNNWAESDAREYLNGGYLRELENVFGVDNIFEHIVNLLSLDGLDDYGKTTDKVSLLTVDQYRKYRKIICKNLDSWWWLATPDSTPSGYGARYVRCVDSDGDVDCRGYGSDGGVRPFCILKSNIFVS